jgi:hypothetical protein
MVAALRRKNVILNKSAYQQKIRTLQFKFRPVPQKSFTITGTPKNTPQKLRYPKQLPKQSPVRSS